MTESEVITRLPGVSALILRLTRDFTLTKDLTQDVAIAVVVAIREGRIRKPDALTAYMHQSARNIVSASHRKMTPETQESLPEDISAWLQQVLTPPEVFEQQQLRELVLQVLDELPMPRDRELIRGFYVDGLSKAQLLQKLGITADLFDKTLFRARKRMRDGIHKKMQEHTARVEDSPPLSFSISGKARTQ